LRDLLAVYWRDQEDLPERVQHALWLCEHTSHQAFLDVAWPQVVMGLEALVHAGRSYSRRQFTSRVGALAEDVGGRWPRSCCFGRCLGEAVARGTRFPGSLRA
jgi:hypothetical protein